MWPEAQVCAHDPGAWYVIKSVWQTLASYIVVANYIKMKIINHNTKIQLKPVPFIWDKLVLSCWAECDLNPQGYFSPVLAAAGVASDWSPGEFMAVCQGSCCTGHHSTIFVMAEK